MSPDQRPQSVHFSEPQQSDIIVAKFGGSSVATPEKIQHCAQLIAREHQNGHRILVVVSAMQHETDRLVALWKSTGGNHPSAEEHDTIVSTGEQVTAGLMAVALHRCGVNARSYCGWQAGITTSANHGDALIENIDSDLLHRDLADGIIPVVTGFQGISGTGRITTLGRGGSDTTAMALAVALGATRCDLYKTEQGVATTDPKVVPEARKLDLLPYADMAELSARGSKILEARAARIAMDAALKVQFLSSEENYVGSDLVGTLLVPQSVYMAHFGNDPAALPPVTGIALSDKEALVTLENVDNKEGTAAKIFNFLGSRKINVDHISQPVAHSGEEKTSISFSVMKKDLDDVKSLEAQPHLRELFGSLNIREDVTRVTAVGSGMTHREGIAGQVFGALGDSDVNILSISTSPTSVSVFVDNNNSVKTTRALHRAFGLHNPT